MRALLLLLPLCVSTSPTEVDAVVVYRYVAASPGSMGGPGAGVFPLTETSITLAIDEATGLVSERHGVVREGGPPVVSIRLDALPCPEGWLCLPGLAMFARPERVPKRGETWSINGFEYTLLKSTALTLLGQTFAVEIIDGRPNECVSGSCLRRIYYFSPRSGLIGYVLFDAAQSTSSTWWSDKPYGFGVVTLSGGARGDRHHR